MATSEKECQYGYQCTFKDAVNTTYKCSSCNQVAKDLSVTSCCGEFFCQPHLKQLKEEKKKCSKCNKDFIDTPLKPIQNEILKLVVFCTMKKQGCDWEGQLKDLDEHEDSCKCFIVQCPNKCDQDQITRSQLAEHLESECPNRDYTCPHCNFKGTHVSVTKEHIPQCVSSPVKCPHNCGAQGTRDNMETHECHMCRFSFAGCKERFRREDEEQHMDRNLRQHLDLLAKSVEKIAEENEGLRGIIADGINPNGNAEIGKKMEDFMAEILEKQRNQNKQNEDEMSILRDKLGAERERVEELEKQVNNLQTNTVRDDISPPEHHGEAEQQKTHQLQQKLEEQKREFEEQKREFEEQKRASKQLESRLALLERSAGAVVQPVNPAPPPDALACLTLHQFTEHKVNNERWCSSSFSAPEGGPNFKMEVWPNGQKDGQGTHVSVWFVRDDFSYYLKCVSIHLRLLASDHNNAEDIDEATTFNDIDHRYVGGFHKLLPHSQLNYYLENDCLTFQICSLVVSNTY